MSETVADRFRRLAARFTTVVEAASDAMEAPSPCEGWDVREVIDHVVTTQHDICGRVVTAPDLTGHDSARRWPQMRDAVQAVLDDPERAATAYDGFFGPTTFEATIDTFYSPDLLVHSWDIARAIGRTDLEPMDPADLARVREGLGSLGDAVRSPGVFGAQVEVPADASEQDRFLAWTGRRP